MKRICLLLSLTVFVVSLQAHRLDECLQATRIMVKPGGIELSFSITPGVEIAGPFMAVLDRDGSGSVSAEESAGFAANLLQDVSLSVDQIRLDLMIAEVDVPPLADLRRGTAAIRVLATSGDLALAAGRHELTFTNQHLPHLSVHLVNVLKPADESVVILKQSRSRQQTEYRLDFLLESSHKSSSLPGDKD